MREQCPTWRGSFCNQDAKVSKKVWTLLDAARLPEIPCCGSSGEKGSSKLERGGAKLATVVDNGTRILVQATVGKPDG